MSYTHIRKVLNQRLQAYDGGTRLFCGLRFLAFSGDFLRAVEAEDVVDDWLERVFKKLPPDATAVQHPMGDFLFQGVSLNAYCDEVLLLLCSREWSRVEDGKEIPQLEIRFEQQGITRFEELKSQWYWRLYFWATEKAVRRFPKWIKH